MGISSSFHSSSRYQGISISEEQVAWANKHLCSDRLKIVLSDYRAMPEDWIFDAIVSVRSVRKVSSGENEKAVSKADFSHQTSDFCVSRLVCLRL